MPPVKILACEVVLDAMRPFLSEDIVTETVPMSLHVNPKALRDDLQVRIDAADGQFDPIVLGFGLCSQATVGLRAACSRLVVARTDDCIGIFLGSRDAYRSQLAEEPGTYFLTRGWAGADIPTPFTEYDRAKKRWGAERAKRLLDSMLQHYRRLVYINTPGEDLVDERHDFAKDASERFSLRYEELPGDTALIEELVRGPWGERCVVVEPGEKVVLGSFFENKTESRDEDGRNA